MKDIKKILRVKQLFSVFLIGMLFIMVTIVEIAITYIFRVTIDINSYEGIYRFLNFTPYLLGLAALYGFGKYITTKKSIVFSSRIVRKEKVKLTEHIQQLPVATIKRFDIGDLYTSSHENISSLEEFFRLLPGAIASPIIIIITLMVMFFYSWKLSLVAIASIPLPIFLFEIINKPIEKKVSKNLNNIGRVNNLLKSSLEGIDTIKAYSLYKVFSDKFYKGITRVRNQSIGIERVKSKANSLSFFLRIFPQCVIPLYCAYLAMKGEVTLGLLPAFGFLIGNIFMPIETLMSFSSKYRESMAAIGKINSLYQLETEKDGCKTPIIDLNPIIEFTNVDFAYLSRDVLKNISFSINRNQLIAIIGESGSGKSTIIKLITGLYQNYRGSIKVFQQEVVESDLAELRKNIAVMSQNVFLLPISLRENILYGIDNYGEDELMKAAAMVNLDEVVNKLPEGYQTILSERGMNLSSGQRQRIAFARAILKKAPLIILDEATSGLDPFSIDVIIKSLNVLKENHTIVVVTHDIQLASKADEIILVDKNRIINKGSHEILKNDPLYQSMLSKQNFEIEEV